MLNLTHLEGHHFYLKWLLMITSSVNITVDVTQLFFNIPGLRAKFSAVHGHGGRCLYFWRIIKVVLYYVFVNLIRIAGPACVIICTSMADIKDEKNFWHIKQQNFWRLLSYTAILVWVRLGILLRSSHALSWMTTLVSESIISITGFVVVLLIGIIAFADTFYAIDRILIIQGYESDESLAHIKFEKTDDMTLFDTYLAEPFKSLTTSLLVALGEFENIQLNLYNELDWIFFFLAAFFNLILMMNLLISIITETYTSISST